MTEVKLIKNYGEITNIGFDSYQHYFDKLIYFYTTKKLNRYPIHSIIHTCYLSLRSW
jgi:hypothetical protein